MDTDEYRLDPEEQEPALLVPWKRRSIAIVEMAAFVGAVLAVIILTRHPGDGGSAKAATAPPGQAIVATPQMRTTVPLTLEVVRLDGSSASPIAYAPSDIRGSTISPDGRTLAFISWSTGFPVNAGFCGGCGHGPRLFTRSIGARASRMFEVPGPGPGVDMPAWSPDGSRIAFVRFGGKGRGRVGIVDADGKHVRMLTAPSGKIGSPAWSPDGSSIAYADRGDIWMVPAPGGGSIRLTMGPAVDDQPAFSQDGRIAFTRDGSIWVMAADASHAHPIPSIPPGSVAPRWSPHGDRITFLVPDATRSADLNDPRSGAVTTVPAFAVWIVDLATGTRMPLGVETAGKANAPSWLSAGDALLVERLD
jgi:dipeptidyl aminopeptidase/acylaminoacyl peptidase